ncbi:MAG: DUF4279 domain-containing protein [Dehalococcoidia bacterium]|nr:DUF4279 domain-containing protein [Dehalococcoidia bacterium]
MEIGAYLYFRISGDNLCLDEITQTLNMHSPSVRRKGEFVKSRFGEQFDTTIKEDSWSVYCEIEEDQSFENAVLEFLQPFLPHKDFIVDLTKRYEVIFYPSLYPRGYHMYIHFPNKVLEILNVLNIELGIVAEYLEEFYNGNY